jgi:enamine deaminase RidA (YjgF/YER057c/UK114 family)
MAIEERLADLGISLLDPKAPVANYLGTRQSGKTLHVSARVSEQKGAAGSDVTEAEAYRAARDTLILLLAIIKFDVGDLDRIANIDQLRGYVRSGADFIRQPQVIDGASDLLVDIFGEAGRHARTATGSPQLPSGATVQLEMTVTLY